MLKKQQSVQELADYQKANKQIRKHSGASAAVQTKYKGYGVAIIAPKRSIGSKNPRIQSNFKPKPQKIQGQQIFTAQKTDKRRTIQNDYQQRYKKQQASPPVCSSTFFSFKLSYCAPLKKKKFFWRI